MLHNRLLAGALLALTLCACGVNPVTGKREIQFVSEAQELQIGAQQYAPTRQSEGGDFRQVPELTAYVSEIGQKLAAVSDRQLPYEFAVVENRAPVALVNVQVTPVLVDAAGRVVRQAAPVRIGRTLAAGERVLADAGVGVLTQEQLAAMRFRVDGARIAE